MLRERECTQGLEVQAIMDAMVKVEPVQLSTEIRITSNHVTYRLTPLPTITAYQSLRITILMFVVATSQDGAIDDAWQATYSETAEHWTRIED